LAYRGWRERPGIGIFKKAYNSLNIKTGNDLRGVINKNITIYLNTLLDIQLSS